MRKLSLLLVRILVFLNPSKAPQRLARSICISLAHLLVDNAAGKVTSSTHSTATNPVQRRIDRLLDHRLPIPPSILGGVNRALASRHLGLVGTQGDYAGRVTGELGGERNFFPRFTCVSGVENYGGSAKNPSLAVLERDLLEAVCHLEWK